MSEIDKHYLIFDRPHIYKCSCGFEVLMFIGEDMKIYSKPKKEIKYLSCGHAVCCARDIGGYPNNEKAEVIECMICLHKG